MRKEIQVGTIPENIFQGELNDFFISTLNKQKYFSITWKIMF